MTGLESSALWAAYCHTSTVGEFEEGDKVVFRFEALSPTEVVTLAQVQSAANGRGPSLVGTFETPDINIPVLPAATVDISEVYARVYVTCDQIGPGADSTSVFIEAISTYVDPIALRGTAEAALTLLEPEVGTNPPFDEKDRFGVVRFPTWLWIDDTWDVVGPEFAANGPAQVAVAAIPNYVAWDMGDGEDIFYCQSAGVEWRRGLDEDDTNCSYTYTRSSAGVGPDNAYDIAATMNWTLVWWVNGTYLGVYDSTERTTNFTYQIGEIQSVSS